MIVPSTVTELDQGYWVVSCTMCPDGVWSDAIGYPIVFASYAMAESARQRHDRWEHRPRWDYSDVRRS